jgi:penicillin-binding protein 1C
MLHRNHPKKNSMGLIVKIALGLAALLFGGLLALLFTGAGTVVGVYAYFAQGLPDPSAIERAQKDFETTKIYDRTGQHLLYEIFDPQWGDRTYLAINQIPVQMRQATVAIEDRTFYENPGVDLRGIARAALSNFRGEQIQGASSITMQLVKNVLIPPEERYVISYERKIKEAILALEISRRYPGRDGKDKVLEWYLNNNFYGNLAYGVEAAAQTYFGKHAGELNLAECAMLAAIPQYPGMNPIDNPEAAEERQNLVLDQMLREGYITEAQAVDAKQTSLEIAPQKRFEIDAPHFAMYVRRLLEDEFGPDMVYQGGLRVYTTLDWDMQQIAEKLAREQIAKLREEKWDINNAGVIVIRPNTGEILTMIGSLDYFSTTIKGQVNVTLSPRQPGSSFKPFNYVTALAQGYTPATMLLDVRQAFDDSPNPPYVPENYSLKYMGPQRMRLALARSLNIPAVEMLSKVGVKNVIHTAHQMGLNTLTQDFYGLSLTLGGGEATLLDMAYAYSVFANSGVMAGQSIPPDKQQPGFRQLDPVAILLVTDREGKVIKQFTQPSTREVLSPQLAYLIQDMISDNNARTAAFGPDSVLKLSRPAGVKTGTTNDFRDDWIIGFTPQLAAGFWCGNTDYEPMGRIPASRAVGPAWNAFMEKVHENLPVMEFKRPPGIIEAYVCPLSGLVATENCPSPVKEIFIAGTEPSQPCDMHREFKINKVTGRLATIFTPPELVESRVFEIYPPRAADWVREQGIPQPPTQYDDAYGPGPAQGDVAIISPAPYSYVSTGVVIIGNARSDNFHHWRLEYGQGLNPSAWSQIGGEHYNQVTNGPLEFWEVSQLDGLYTLQLTVVRNDQGVTQTAIHVNVDNTPPKVTLIHPDQDDVYVKEQDDYVNVQADARDNLSMDRVEFFIDSQPQSFGLTTVAPYSQKWTIVMSDTIPVAGTAITTTGIITNPDGSVIMGVITVTEVITGENGLITQIWANGMSVISDTHGYTETHTLHAVAYDSAGNKTESEKVRIQIIHRPKPEKKGSAAPPLAPVAWRDERQRNILL